jgi:hypothetical protein
MTIALVSTSPEISKTPANTQSKDSIRRIGSGMRWRSFQWNWHSQFDIGSPWKRKVHGGGKEGERSFHHVDRHGTNQSTSSSWSSRLATARPLFQSSLASVGC